MRQKKQSVRSQASSEHSERRSTRMRKRYSTAYRRRPETARPPRVAGRGLVCRIQIYHTKYMGYSWILDPGSLNLKDSTASGIPPTGFCLSASGYLFKKQKKRSAASISGCPKSAKPAHIRTSQTNLLLLPRSFLPAAPTALAQAR